MWSSSLWQVNLIFLPRNLLKGNIYLHEVTCVNITLNQRASTCPPMCKALEQTEQLTVSETTWVLSP